MPLNARDEWEEQLKDDELQILYAVVEFLSDNRKIKIEKYYKLTEMTNIKKLNKKLLKYIK